MIKVSIGLDIFCLLILSLILVSLLTQKKENRKDSFFMYLMIPDAMIYIISSLIPMNFYGNPDFNTFNCISNIFSYVTGNLLVYLFLGYILTLIQNPSLSKKINITAQIIYLLSLIPIVITPFTRWIFYFENGNLMRGKFYILGFAYVAIIYVTAITLAFSQKKLLLSERIIIILDIIIHLLAAIGQTLYPNLKITFCASCLVIIMLYMLIYCRRGQTLSDVKDELSQAQISMMLSKIQPHFLFNSLSSISELCKENPESAQKAIEDFAKYLRFNMDSLGNSSIVNFKTELQHTEVFLKLEKLRFDTRLNVEYNIQCDDFQLPSLTLQPIVENAVKHGIMKRDEGGTVIISTEKTENNFIIKVTDNGVGFNQNASVTNSHNSNRSHIGINNVKNRLKKLCNGSLEINSIPEKGTTVTITIPWEIQTSTK